MSILKKLFKLGKRAQVQPGKGKPDLPVIEIENTREFKVSCDNRKSTWAKKKASSRSNHRPPVDFNIGS